MSARWFPWLFAALFVPVFAINGVLVSSAFRSNTGLVSDRSFDTGQDYNRIIAAGRQQPGWNAEIKATAAEIAVTLRDASGEKLRGLKVAGRLFSPVDPQPDQELALAEDSDGVYRQSLKLPRAGQWQAELMANDFAIEQRLVLR
jgi:nitrogen fixation protein FixH